jgi:hypothetical protein
MISQETLLLTKKTRVSSGKFDKMPLDININQYNELNLFNNNYTLSQKLKSGESINVIILPNICNTA